MQKRMYPAYLLLLLLFFSCTKNGNVVKVGSYHLNLQEFKDILSTDRRAPKTLTEEYVMAKVQSLADYQVQLAHAKKENYDELPSIISTVNKTREDAIYTAVIQNRILDPVIPESLIKQKYDQNGVEWKLRHIMLKKTDNEAGNQALIKQLQDIRPKINKDNSFGDVAKSLSQDSLTANRSGSLGVVKWGARDFGDGFYNAVNQLPLDKISDVIESDIGYHLVLVKERNTINLAPYALAEENIRRTLIPQYTDSLNSVFYRFVQEIEKHYNTEYNSENMRAFLNIINNAGELNPNKLSRIDKFVNSLTDEQKNIVLATFADTSMTVDQLMNIFGRINPSRRPRLESIEKVREILSRNVAHDLIVKYGFDNNYAKNPTVVEQVVERQEELMVQFYKKDNFVRPVVSPEEVETFYNEHIDDYQQGIKMQVQEIYLGSLEEAQDLKAKLEAGGDFDLLAERFNTRKKTKDSKGMLGWISPRQYSVIGKTASSLTVGEVSSPIRLGQHYSIIRVLDKTFDSYRELDKVKNPIRQQLYSQKENQAFREWIEELSKDLSVTINEQIINKEFGFEKTAG